MASHIRYTCHRAGLQDSENRLAPEVSLVQFLPQNCFVDFLQLGEREFLWKQLEAHRRVLEFIA
jgi:hypothetical protein